MKLTSEELNKIILEEIQNFLNEQHPALDKEDDSMIPDEPEDVASPMTADEFASSMTQTGRDIKSSPMKGEMKPREMGEVSDMLKKLLKITVEDGDATSLLKKIGTSIERVLDANKG